jgi:hypothetical protein
MAFLDTSLRVIRANPFLHTLFARPPGGVEGRSLTELLTDVLEVACAEEAHQVCLHTLQPGEPHLLTAWPMGYFDKSNRGRFTDWEIRRIETTENISVGIPLTISDITRAHE